MPRQVPVTQSIELILLTLLAPSALSADIHPKRVFWDRYSAGIVDRGVQVPPEGFTRENLISACQDFLRDSQAAVAHLTFIPSGQTILFFQLSESTYGAWLRNYKRYLGPSTRVAEMVAIGENAVLRVRDGPTVWRHLLVGRDPLIYRVGGETFEILHFSLSTFLVYPFRIYARCSGELTIPKARQFYSDLQELLPTAASVTIRNDQWFYGFLSFPQAYWYDLTEPPPKVTVILSAPEIECRGGRSSADCQSR